MLSERGHIVSKIIRTDLTKAYDSEAIVSLDDKCAQDILMIICLRSSINANVFQEQMRILILLDPPGFGAEPREKHT